MSYSPKFEIAFKLPRRTLTDRSWFSGSYITEWIQRHLNHPLIHRTTQGSGGRMRAGICGPGQLRVCWAHSDCGPVHCPSGSCLPSLLATPCYKRGDWLFWGQLFPFQSHSFCDHHSPHHCIMWGTSSWLSGYFWTALWYLLCWAWFWI